MWYKISKVILICLFALLTIWTSVYLSSQICEIYLEDNTIATIQNQPSYEYLKSVTVLINGSGEYPLDLDEEALKILKEQYNYETEDGNTSDWMGTGVIVKIQNGYTYILTNAHVVGKEMENVILFVENEYQQREAELISCHSKLDMALIKVKGKLKNKQTIKGISTANPQDKIYVVGHHLGTKYIYGEGVFAGYAGIYDKIQVPCLWGNSGSGIFDKDGNLIALICAVEYRVLFIFPVFNVAHALALDGLSIEMFLNKISEIK